jgi:hypothetical protein
MPLLVHKPERCKAVQTHGSVRLSSMDMLNKNHIPFRSKAVYKNGLSPAK